MEDTQLRYTFFFFAMMLKMLMMSSFSIDIYSHKYNMKMWYII